jgi:hypothetical protein
VSATSTLPREYADTTIASQTRRGSARHETTAVLIDNDSKQLRQPSKPAQEAMRMKKARQRTGCGPVM